MQLAPQPWAGYLQLSERGGKSSGLRPCKGQLGVFSLLEAHKVFIVFLLKRNYSFLHDSLGVDLVQTSLDLFPD